MAANTPDSNVPPNSATPGLGGIPMAQPIEIPADSVADVPLALPVELPPDTEVPLAMPVTLIEASEPLAEVVEVAEVTAVVINCPVCGSARRGEMSCCDDCGYYFTAADLAAAGDGECAPTTADPVAMPTARLQDRYELTERLGDRGLTVRYRGLDHGTTPPTPILVVQQSQAAPTEASEEDEFLPTFDLPGQAPPVGDPATSGSTTPPAVWPGIGWEVAFLGRVGEEPLAAALPRQLDRFEQDGSEYLVMEQPQGTVLWDAWDDPDANWERKFGHLVKIAETIAALHRKQVIFEALRPDLWVIDDHGQVRLTDLGELLPLPLPLDAPIRGRLYTAPEVLSLSSQIDARADLFGFGAMLYALQVGREPTERDFARQGDPKPFIPQFPDIHPALGRLMSRTFRREVGSRFPTDEAGKQDATGFQELIHTLTAMARTFDTVRLEIASWTTIGMIRTGNEDGFALLHATEWRQDDLGEQALILLCDGMGGYEAGEVAAALAIQVLRRELLQHPALRAVAGRSPFPVEPLDPVPEAGYAPPAMNVKEVQELVRKALREANKAIYTASRAPGAKRQGMGCTAEVVFTDGRNLVVGHVGDSRTYHLNEGRLVQVTRDQTLVNRLVELGQLSEEEAENHPRKNELQQALGGRPDVDPAVYTSVLHAGDWVLVCSDGVTNHVGAKDLQQMLQLEAGSAETAARRLVNLTNIEGATDNATVVVVRCT